MGLLKEAVSLKASKKKGKDQGFSSQRMVNWNGFVSNSGIGKSSMKAANKSATATHPTPTAEKVDKLVKLCNLSLNNLYTNLLLMCYES